jgi:peptidoglycan hydrolase-like protein with peptidoglycan-binding domain
MGPWAAFKEKAYSLKQDAFPYLLVDGRDLQRVILNGVKPVPVTLRFGSKGPLVSEVQTALKKLGYYEGKIDEDFGNRTLRAVLAFQTNAFGPQADDGVVGPITALALGIAWPKL